jgi:hypothetical protein
MRSFNSRDALLAGGLLHQVIKQNLRDAKTHGWLSFLGVVEASGGWTEDQKTTATTSIADGLPYLAWTHGIRTVILGIMGRYAKALVS